MTKEQKEVKALVARQKREKADRAKADKAKAKKAKADWQSEGKKLAAAVKAAQTALAAHRKRKPK
jgi:hypothetical protein